MTLKSEVNPYMGQFSLNVIRYIHEDLIPITEEHKALTGRIVASNKHDVETQPKTSLYNDSKLKDVLFKLLKTNGRDLFLYIATNMSKDLGYIRIDKTVVSEVLGMSRTTFYNAVNQLIINDIIRRRQGKNYLYWVNPIFIFNGNRPKYFESFNLGLLNVVATKYTAKNHKYPMFRDLSIEGQPLTNADFDEAMSEHYSRLYEEGTNISDEEV